VEWVTLKKQREIISAYMQYLIARTQTTAIVLPIHHSVPTSPLVHLLAPIIHQNAQSFLGAFLGTPSPIALHTLGM